MFMSPVTATSSWTDQEASICGELFPDLLLTAPTENLYEEDDDKSIVVPRVEQTFEVEETKPNNMDKDLLEEILREAEINMDEDAHPEEEKYVPSGVDNTQSLIDEMEAFLSEQESSYSDSVASSPQYVAVSPQHQQMQSPTHSMIASPQPQQMQSPTHSMVSDEDISDAEAVLDALVKGNVYQREIKERIQEQPQQRLQPEQIINQNLNGVKISNISEITTATGEKVIIVITNDEEPKPKANKVSSPMLSQTSSYQPRQVIKQKAPASPAPSSSSAYSSGMDDSDDWTPNSSPSQVLKKAVPAVTAKNQNKGTGKKRGPYKRSQHSKIKDRKERKKLQNVEAARRYRDKKKAEKMVEMNEEDVEISRNLKLKAKLAEVQSEVKTLKKLMTELGLLKFPKQSFN